MLENSELHTPEVFIICAAVKSGRNQLQSCNGEKGEAAQEVTSSLATAKEISAALAWTLVSMIICVKVYFKLLCLISAARWPTKGRLAVRRPGEDKKGEVKE